jgi:hypothetical protein
MMREVCLRLGCLLAENHSYFVSGWVSKKTQKRKREESMMFGWRLVKYKVKLCML